MDDLPVFEMDPGKRIRDDLQAISGAQKSFKKTALTALSRQDIRQRRFCGQQRLSGVNFAAIPEKALNDVDNPGSDRAAGRGCGCGRPCKPP
jgi:hypothetical protein